MRPGVPWSVKGIEPEAREAAKIAARREGVTLGQWLNQKIFEASSDEEDDTSSDMPAHGDMPPSAGIPSGNSMPQQALQVDFSPVTDALRDLVRRLERSERRSDNALAGLDETLADMATRLERTERASRDSGLETTLGDLRERLEKSERGLERAELLNTDAMRTVERGLRAISSRLEDTERRAEEAARRAMAEDGEGVRGLKSSLEDLARRLDAAETTAQSAREQAAQAVNYMGTRDGASDDAVKALERAIGNVVDHIEASDERTAKAIKSLQGSVDQLNTDVAEVRQKSGGPANIEAIKSLETTLAAIQQNLSDVTGRLGNVESTSRRDIDQIAQAIDDMGGRLDRVRDAAVEAAVEAAGKQGGGANAQLVANLESKIDETARRLDRTEKESAEAIHAIESSIGDIAGQMREVASLGGNGGKQFAEPLAALEHAIDEMASRLQTSDQRSAQALAKVEELSDELLRKLDANAPSDEIRKIQATIEDVDSRLELIESRNGPATSAAPAAERAAPPPPPPADTWTSGDRDDNPFGPPPPPPAAASNNGHMGAPPFPDAGQPQPPEPPRDDFLESARRAARAAASDPRNEGARSPFAASDRGFAIPGTEGRTGRKTFALLAAGLVLVVAVGVVVLMTRGGPQEVAGPPDDIEIPADTTAALDAELDAPAADSDRVVITPSSQREQAAEQEPAEPAAETAAPAEAETPAETEVARAPAREIPDVVPPAEASTGNGTQGPTAITPRREVDVAALPEPQARPARLPSETDNAAVPAQQQPARRTLREAASDGDAVAQYEIGQRYANGSNGVPQDYDQAAFWFNRAAEQGLAPAQYRLGTLFEKGLGTPENPTKARTWYERAAGQGNVKAMHNLAVMQAEGAGGPQDFAAAARNFEQAAKAGLGDSQYNLAILHERGLGVERDLARAYQWFAIAAEGGDADAGARAEALKNSVDAAKLVDAELAARTFSPQPSDPAANNVVWQAEAPAPALVREAQRLLGQLGYNAGAADGILGEQTVDAVRDFERDRGLAITGQVDERLLDALQQATL